MTYTDFVRSIATESGVSPRQVRQVLSALSKVAVAALADGHQVPLRGLCTIGSRWRGPRSLRDIRSRHRIMLDGRFVVRFTASKKVRQALASRTPQLWNAEGHQDAWRAAEALIGDLELYHSDIRPGLLTSACPPEIALQQCAVSFGSLWDQVLESYQERVPPDVRSRCNYLALAALEAWGDRPHIESLEDT